LITYLSIYIYLTVILLSEIKLNHDSKKFYFILLFIFILLFVSGRHYVGGDYVKYLYWFEHAKLFPPKGLSLLFGLNYITIFSHTLSLNYFLFNFLCALIFLSGIFKFLNISNERLFVFILLIPTMIYVVGLGYTRQSVSIGFLCLAIYYWSENKNVKKFIFFILSVLVHLSSLIFIFILFYKSYEKIKFSKLYVLSTLTIGFLFIFFILYFNSLYNLSSAIGLDVKINIANSRFKYLKFLAHIAPCIIFIFFLKEFKKDKKIYPLYFFSVVITITVIVAMIILKILIAKSSFIDVMADRILLPFLLIEALIFVRLYSIVNLEYKFLFKLLILFYFGFMLFIWLEFADNSYVWQPYRSILLESYNADFNVFEFEE
jgi:hypothetical protein